MSSTLKSSLGALRSILQHQTPPNDVLRRLVGKTWRRNLSYRQPALNTEASQWRMGLNQATQASRRHSQSANGFSRIAQHRSAFRSSRRTFHSSRARNSQSGAKEGAQAETEPQSLSARLKKLSREYGWAAVGVYLGLSVLDFPFCFLLVRTVGTDKVATVEHWVVEHIKQFIPATVQNKWHEYSQAMKKVEKDETGTNRISEEVEMAGWGVKEAEEKHKAEASLATQLALAYAIHKSFIFVRVPLTAAVTPKVVKVLRSWGWKIGRKKA